MSRYMVTRFSSPPMNVIMSDIPRKAAGESRPAVAVEHIALEAAKTLDQGDAGLAHGKSGGGESVGVADVAGDHGQAYDIGDQPIVMRIVDMLSADRRPRGGNRAIADREHLDDLMYVERVT